jgi:trimeric autotransporter adhesin
VGSFANGTTATALGEASIAHGVGATAVGQLSLANATGATAVGQGAIVAAGATNGTALGQGATVAAGATNAAAIGAGAVATVPNSMVFGTGTNTYQMPGIASAASLASQVGPTNFVTSDGAGHLALSAFGPATISALQNDVRRGFEGTAIAIAMGGTTLPWDKNFAISGNWGTFAGENAAGFSALVRPNPNWVFNAGVGAGFAHGGVGGRAGLTFAW